jgi:FKBP-type peptidyl-prolyl cis-trans isomerase FkpA
MRFLPCLLACALLSGCLTQPKGCNVNPSDPATETFAPTLGINLSTMEKTALGDYRRDDLVGSGDKLTSLGVVQIHYTAYLVDGTVVDQVTSQPFPIDLSTRATIGLADGMLGMNVGGQRTIVVPSELALGACAAGTIPGNSTLIYKVELLALGA